MLVLVFRPTKIDDFLFEETPKLILIWVFEEFVEFLFVDFEDEFFDEIGIKAVLKILYKLNGLWEISFEDNFLEKSHLLGIAFKVNLNDGLFTFDYR